MRVLVAGADAESESPVRQLIASAPGKVAIRFDASNPAAIQWAKTRGAELVREVTKSQRETIRKVLTKAMQENTPVRQTAGLLKGVLPLDSRRAAAAQRVFETQGAAAAAKEIDRLTKQRALVIARTETMRASNEGQRRLWEQRIAAGNLPKTMQRVWITTPDDRLCPVCAPLDGARAPMDGSFPGGLSGPPAHPQCRCAQGLVSAAKPVGPSLGVTGPQVPASSPSAKPKSPARKVMDEAGLPNLSIAMPVPGAGNSDPDWDIVTNPDKGHAAIATIHLLREELQSKYNVSLAVPGLSADSVTGRMKISQVLTATRLVKSSKDVLVEAGLLADAGSMPFELRFTENPTKGAVFMFADTAYTQAGGVLSQKIVVNLSSPALVNLTALKSVLKQNQDAGWLAGKSPESVFIHEMGHLAQANTAHGAKIQKAASAFWEDPAKKTTAGKVSKYAASKPSEFVAEVFAGMAEGVTYDTDVLAMYADLGGKFPVKSGAPIKSGLNASSVSQAPVPTPTKAPTKPTPPIPPGEEGAIIMKVLELRAQGLSYNAIEKAMGWPPQKGFKAFAIVKKWGPTPNAAAESPTAAPVAGPGTGASVAKPVAAPPSTVDQPTDASHGVGAAKATSLFNKAVAANEFALSQEVTFKPVSSSDVASHKIKFKATLDALEKKFYAQGYKLIGEVPTGGANIKLTWQGPDGTFEVWTTVQKVEFAPAMGSAWNNQSQYKINVKKVGKAVLAPSGLPSVPPAVAVKPATPDEVVAAKPTPTVISSNQPSPTWFDSLLKGKIAGAKGSNPGGIYKTEAGEQYYVKQYANPAQGHGENLANALYSKLGLKTPESVTGVASNGQQLYASKWMKGLKGTAKELGYDSNQARKFMDGFLADVLTANWDAAGTGLDNFGFLEDGTIARLDQGGSFLYRAQAGLKPKELLNKVSEWDSFFGKNIYYAQVAAKAGIKKAEDLGGDELNNQLNRLKMLVPDWTKKADWRKLVDSLGGAMSESDRNDVAEMLHTRMGLINEKVQNAAGIPPKPVPKAEPPPPPPTKGWEVVTPGAGETTTPQPQDSTVKKGPPPPEPKKPAVVAKMQQTDEYDNVVDYLDGLTDYDQASIDLGVKVSVIHEIVAYEKAKAAWDKHNAAPATKGWDVFVPPPALEDNPAYNIPKPTLSQVLPPLPPSGKKNPTSYVSSENAKKIEAWAAQGYTAKQIAQATGITGAAVQAKMVDVSTQGSAFTQPVQAPSNFQIPSDSMGRLNMPRPSQQGQIDALNKAQNPWLFALPQAEQDVIRMYTGSWYATVNGYLRTGHTPYVKDTSNLQKKADLLQKALLSAPSPPPPAMVYRTMGIEPAMEAALTPGAEVVLKGFQSATVNEKLNFGGGKALFEIIPKRGGWVAPISASPGHGDKKELEYLLPHAEKYRVLSKKNVGGKILIRIEML
jgi:hypothetical protein